MENLVEYSITERVGYITLNRPEKRNALNDDTVRELISLFKRAGNDDQVKVIILKAKGTAFCAGADLEYMQSLQSNTLEENKKDSNHLKELFHTIYHLPKIVIAQIQGHAIAGGCGLATVCDFSFAVPEAKFGYTEVKIGFIPAIVMFFLLRKVGEGIAKELLLTGNLIDAEKARNLGLINRVVQADKLESAVAEFAQRLCEQNSAQAMAMTKTMIANIQEMSLDKALDYAARMNAQARSTSDCQKGIAAFLNKDNLLW
jgi:methylglutaconyl-CoA hydratase